MAARWLETDSGTNVNIASAVSIGAYTADADRIIVVDVSLDQVAGNGDYVVYLTRQINGAGSAYVMLPKTTCAAASGETAIAMQSGMVTVRSGDVVTCYIDGLAGDTTTPDTTVRWFEVAALMPTVAGRTLDVSAGGAVALAATQGAVTFGQVKILANVANEGALHAVNSHADGIGQFNQGGGTGQTNVGETYGQYNEGIGGGGAAGQYNVGSAAGQRNAGDTADVDGVDAAGIWTYATRTLTQTAAQVTAAVTGSALNITRAATWAATISGLSIGATWEHVYLTIKANDRHEDDNALLQVIVSNPAAGSTDGVLYVNRAAATAGQRTTGALTVNQGAGTVAIALQDDLTELLPLKPDAVYDLKALYADGSSVVLTRSTATISAAVTGAI